MSEEIINNNALTDEEVSEASGGALFNKCPHGTYESLALGNVLGTNDECLYRCDQCTITLMSQSKDSWKYEAYCSYFNRRKTVTTYESL